MKRIAAILIPLAAAVGFTACEIWPDWYETPAAAFRTGFKGTSVIAIGEQTDVFRGIDPDHGAVSDWSTLDGLAHIGRMIINYEAGTPDQRWAKPATDPDDPENSVLEFRVVEPHIVEGDHMKGRVSAILDGLQEVRAFSQTIRLRFDASLAVLENWERQVDWFTVFEFWSGDYDRLTVAITKPKGAGLPLVWQLTRDTRWLLGKWENQWKETAETLAVAWGEWMELSLYVRTGAEGQARVQLAIEEVEGLRHSIFDSDRAVGNPEGFTKINPFKLYTSDRLIAYVVGADARLTLWWDDWAFWFNDESGF